MALRAVSLLVFAAAGVVWPSIASSQTSSSGIVGYITDPFRYGVAAATLEVRNLETGVERRTLTDANGFYSLMFLPPGFYRIAAGGDSFRPVVRSSVSVEVNQTLRLDIQLALGTLRQRVEVTDMDPLLQESSSELGTVIDSKAMLDLPLNGRNFQQLLGLAAGTNGRAVQGQWAAGDLYELDGVNNNNVDNDVNNPKPALVPILDSIQEFKVQSHNDLAEYGGVLGGIVDIVSKSGTNDARGSAWEFLRNSALDARNPFTDAGRSGPSPLRQNQFGLTFGGPVIAPRLYDGRNRTFFFFGYEGVRNHGIAATLSRVPTASELAGDFSGSIAGQRIFDPATEHLDPVSGLYVASPFSGNKIPASRISPAMSGMFSLMFDAPNYGGDPFYNRLDDFRNVDDQNSFTTRIDHQLTARDYLWLRYSAASEDRLTQQTEEIDQPWSYRPSNLALSWTHAFLSHATVDSRFSRSFHTTVARNILGNSAASAYGDTSALTAVGFSAQKIAQFSLFDTVLASPWSSPGISGETINAGSQPFSSTESIALNLGAHTVQFGEQFLRSKFNNVGRGQHAFFSSAQTADPQALGASGASLASALLGLPERIQFDTNLYTEVFNTWGFFAQDRWNVRPSLTVNLGLRYDQYPGVGFTQGMINDWDFQTGQWLIGASRLPPPCGSSGVLPCIPGGALANVPFGNRIELAPYGAGIRAPIRDNFGPRAGIAWKLWSNTVLRAGYGRFFDVLSSTAQEMQNPSNTWPYAQNFQQAMNGIGQPLMTIGQIQAEPLAIQPASSPWSTVTWFWDPRKKNAASGQWNVEIQRQFTPKLMGSVAYSGSASSRLDMLIPANSAPTPGPGSAAQINLLKPFPYMSTTMYGTDWGVARYNALQITLRKIYSSGFEFLFGYTWSKSMDNGTSNWYSSGPQDSYNLGNSWAPSDYDRTHVATFSGVYELPVGPHGAWLNHNAAGRLIGTWQLNAIVTLESGMPFNLVIPGDVANIGDSVTNYERPNIVGNPRPASQTASEWYNPAAFAVPFFAFGNFGRNVLRSAPMYNADLSMFRLLRPEKRLSGELRLEVFNAFNIMNLGTPDTNIMSPDAGRVTTIQGSPRQLQLAVKLRF